MGSGTTLIETKLLKRKGVGIDINPIAIKIAKRNLSFDKNREYEPRILNGLDIDVIGIYLKLKELEK